MTGKEKRFPGHNVGCARSLQPIDEFWLLLTRSRRGLFERDLAFRVQYFKASCFRYIYK